MAKRVFIDANIFISDGKPPGGDTTRAVRNLANSGKLEVITTDVTINEITKHFTNHDIKNLGGSFRPHIRVIIYTLCDIDLPELDKAEIKERLWRANEEKVRNMMRGLRASELSVDDVSSKDVLTAYSQEKDFFGVDAKKDQISDAFIFETLKTHVSAENPIVIYSNDGDFEKAASEHEHFTLVSDVGGLLALLDLGVTGRDLQHFFFAHQQRLYELFRAQLEDFQFWCSDQSELEAELAGVEHIEFDDLEDFEIVEGEILITGQAHVTINLHVFGPDMSTAMYDNEDGRAYAWDEIDAEKQEVITVDFSMTVFIDSNSVPEEIFSVSLESDDPIWFSLEDIY